MGRKRQGAYICGACDITFETREKLVDPVELIHDNPLWPGLISCFNRVQSTMHYGGLR